MSPVSPPKAPSPSLIRYLHKQSKSLHSGKAFFTRNPTPTISFFDRCPRDAAWGVTLLRGTQKPNSSPRSPTSSAERFRRPAYSRHLSTTPATRATVSDARFTGEGLQDHQVRWASSWGSNSSGRTGQVRDNGAWFGALLGRRKGRGATDNCTSNEESKSMFDLMQSRIAKTSASELRLRCTEFDENGKVTLVNGEFKKSELIAKYGLLPRDLRKIDSSLLPSVLVRPSAILINLLHLRVLVKHNRVLVFDAYGSTDSYTQSLFMYDLEGKLAQQENTSKLPYELRALEAVLISVCSALENEFDGVREPVVRVLGELEEDIDREKLRYLLIYSKKLGTFEQKAKLVRNAIDELLEADDDLSAMYLTDKAAGRARGESDHTEVEMLLESYHKVCDEIVQISGNLVSNIRNTEEIVKAILDANRNALMLLDLKFSIGTLGIGSGAFIAGLYGMNLKNFIEDSGLGFGSITATSMFFATLVIVYGLSKLRRVQRVSMWGERGVGGINVGSADAMTRRQHALRADHRLGLSQGKGSWRDVEDWRAKEEKMRVWRENEASKQQKLKSAPDAESKS